MDVARSLENGFSSVYAKYVQSGFPDNWRSILRLRILVGDHVSSHFRVDHRRRRLSTTRRWNASAIGRGGKRIPHVTTKSRCQCIVFHHISTHQQPLFSLLRNPTVHQPFPESLQTIDSHPHNPSLLTRFRTLPRRKSLSVARILKRKSPVRTRIPITQHLRAENDKSRTRNQPNPTQSHCCDSPREEPSSSVSR